VSALPYVFLPGDPDVEHGVRRIAGELAASTLKGLSDARTPLAARVHEGRKAVKKLRGLIRLVRPAFARYRAETAALRDCAAALAPLREAEMRLSTLAALAPADEAAAAPLIARLEAVRQAALAPERLEAALADYARGLAAVARRARRWEIRPRGARALAAGLARTWHDARAELAALDAGPGGNGEAAPDPAVVHALRKRVKDHWYQARLMRPVFPERLDAEIAAFDRLGEALGRHQDLSDLAAHLDETGMPLPPALAAAERRLQADILRDSLPLARRLLAGSPEDLADRWRTWWTLWRAESALAPASATVVRLPGAPRSAPRSRPPRKAR